MAQDRDRLSPEHISDNIEEEMIGSSDDEFEDLEELEDDEEVDIDVDEQ